MKKYLLLLALSGLTLFQYCSSSKKSAAPKTDMSKVTFENGVQPLVSQKCSPCHTTGNKSHLVDFSESVSHIDEMIERVNKNPGDKGFMPMKHDKLSDSAIAVLVKWKADGLLEKTAP